VIRPTLDDPRKQPFVGAVVERASKELTGGVVFRHDHHPVAQLLALPQMPGPPPTFVLHSLSFVTFVCLSTPVSIGRPLPKPLRVYRDTTRVPGQSSARDNPESIPPGSQALGTPVIPLDKNLQLI